MNLIKILFVSTMTIVLSSISINSNAQNFYLGLGLGIGLNASSQTIGDDYTSTSTGSSLTTTDQNVKGSFGAGMNYGGMVGYKISEHVSAELGVSYLSGSAIQITSNTTDVGNYSVSSTRNMTGSMLRIIPSVKISGKQNIFTPYIRMGLVIGLSPSVTITNDSTDSYTNIFQTPPTTDTVISQTTKLSGGISIGFMGALGLNYKLSNVISIYAEVEMIGQTYAPTTGEMTVNTKDGVDQLSGMTTSQKQTNYVDSYSTTIINNSIPSTQLKFYEPFSSWGFHLGIQFTFMGGSK
jgi:outer membrane protein with beta-barrel domain